MNRIEVIQQVIDRIGAKTYLEIGVEFGTIFSRVRAHKKIAVDPEFRLSLKKKLYDIRNVFSNEYYEVPSDAFFEKEAPRIFKDKQIDVAFVDGMHTYEHSFRDVENVLRYLAPNGVIIMHDCNPPTARSATPFGQETPVSEPGDAYGKAWCGDVWKTVVRLRSSRDDIDVRVLDTDYGLGLVTRGSQKLLPYSVDDIARMDYQSLQEHKKELLNLIPTSQFDSFLSGLKRIEGP